MYEFFSQPVFYLVQISFLFFFLYGYIYRQKQAQRGSGTPMVDPSFVSDFFGLLLIVECFIYSLMELKWWIAIPYTGVSYFIWRYIGAIVHSYFVPSQSSRFQLQKSGLDKYFIYKFFVSIAAVVLFFIMAYQIFFA